MAVFVIPYFLVLVLLDLMVACCFTGSSIIFGLRMCSFVLFYFSETKSEMES